MTWHESEARPEKFKLSQQLVKLYQNESLDDTVALMIFSFVTWSNFLHGNEAPSSHSFYDKFTLVATYIFKKSKKNNNLKTAVVKLKIAIFFTFRWRSICLRTLTISYLKHHHHYPLHPQYRCYHCHICIVDSYIHHHHRNSYRGSCIAAPLCGTDSDSSSIVPRKQVKELS